MTAMSTTTKTIFFSICFIFRLNRIDFRPGWNGTLSNWKLLSHKRNKEHFLHFYDYVFVSYFFVWWKFPFPFSPGLCLCRVAHSDVVAIFTYILDIWLKAVRFFRSALPICTMTRRDIRRLKICLRLLFEIFFAFCAIYFFSFYMFFCPTTSARLSIQSAPIHVIQNTRASTLHISIFIYLQF